MRRIPLIPVVCLVMLVAACATSAANGQSVQPSLPANVERQLDLEYAEYGDRKMHLDLFAPKDAPRPRPAILVLHGGGWLKGDRTKFHAITEALAARGYVAAAVEYRLGGEAKFPAAVQDCTATVCWLRAHAEKYGIDPARIGAVGGSAGGHLVGLLATAPHVEEFQRGGQHADQSSALQAAVVMAGPMELATGPVAEQSRREPEKSFVNQWLGKSVDEAPELYALASPLTHVSNKTPPMLFMSGELDRPELNVATRDRLRSLGIATGIQVYKSGHHGCWNQLPWFTPMVDDIDAFFTQTMPPKLAAADTPKSPNAEADRPVTRPTDWGEIRFGRADVELRVVKPPAGGVIEMPRLNNPVRLVYEKADSSRRVLELKPGIETWSIKLPKSPAESAEILIIVETVGRPYLPTIPRVVSGLNAAIVTNSNDDTVVLAAHDAVTHGTLLRYEPQPHKNTIGYWANEKDWCEWHFHIDHLGRFDLFVLQGCGTGQGGSEVAVKVGEHSVRFTVEDTGHFQNFKERRVGSIALPTPGVHTLEIRPLSKAANAVMDVRQVRLVRVPSASE